MKQAQAELMQAFMKQWLDKLYANNYLGLMLPTTLNTIKTTDLGALISNGALWKASFQHDLDAVPDHVDSLIVLVLKDINTHDPPEPVYDEIGASALLFGTVYRGLKSGQDLETIISSEAYRVVYTTPTLPVSRATDYAMVHRALAGGAALLEATRTEKDGKFNGHLDPLLLLKMDSVTFHDYWKYTCVAHAAQLRVALKVDYADLLLIMEQKWKVGGQLFEARKHMLDVVETAQAIKAMLAPDGNAEKKKFDAQQAVRFAGLVLRLLENGSDMAVLADPASRMTIERNVRPIMNDLMRVDASVIAADYGGAISGIIDLTERFISLDTTRANGEKLKAFSAAINKYGNFMVDILTADSSTNVEAALRKATLGTGGYRVKLTSKAAATISLFPGAFVGQESVSLDNGNTRLTDPSVGAFLPIGISLTAATNWKVLPDVGFYLQALDLGAALNYRLTSSDSVGASPAYSFKSMLSPGAYITTHLGRSPLVLGIGANLTPAMREVTSGTVTTQVNALRFGIFLGVDVTAFQLAASRKKFGDSSGTYRDLHDDSVKKKH